MSEKNEELPTVVSVSTSIHLKCIWEKEGCKQLMDVIMGSYSRIRWWEDMRYESNIDLMPSITMSFADITGHNIDIKLSFTHDIDDKMEAFIKKALNHIHSMTVAFKHDNSLTALCQEVTFKLIDDAYKDLIAKARTAISQAKIDERRKRPANTITEIVKVGEYNIQIRLYERDMAVKRRLSLETTIMEPEELSEEYSCSDDD